MAYVAVCRSDPISKQAANSGAFQCTAISHEYSGDQVTELFGWKECQQWKQKSNSHEELTLGGQTKPIQGRETGHSKGRPDPSVESREKSNSCSSP